VSTRLSRFTLPVLGLATLLAAGSAAAAPYSADAVDVTAAALHLVVIPEDRTDVDVEVKPGATIAAPDVRLERGRVVVDGQLRGRINGCRGGGADRLSDVTIRGLGRVPVQSLPEVVVRVPRTVKLRASGAILARVGASAGGSMAFEGCGAATVADVSGALDLSLVGSGDVDAADVKGPLTAALNGSGDIRIGAAGPARLKIQGSGDLTVARASGDLEARLAGSGDLSVGAVSARSGALSLSGSGDVVVAGGRIETLAMTLAGSGDMRFGGHAGVVSTALAGSGDISVRSADKIASRTKSGSGDIRIGS
jgi:hypothetical protein